jgi:hypothetical protein
MKKTLIFLISAISLTGCSTTEYFYQLNKTSSNEVVNMDNKLVFGKGEITITYDLWGNQGNSTFVLFNNSDSNLFVDLGRSHLILNGLAQTYYKSSAYSESSGSVLSYGSNYSSTYGTKYTYSPSDGYVSSDYLGAGSYSSATTTVSGGQTVTYYEKRIICIPPHAGKIITGFSLKSIPYRDCDVQRFPSKKETSSKKFTYDNSPLIFQNIITYGYDEEFEVTKTISNEMWISEITNYPQKEFFYYAYPEYCGEKSYGNEEYFKYNSPEYFYVKYEKNYETVFNH